MNANERQYCFCYVGWVKRSVTHQLSRRVKRWVTLRFTHPTNLFFFHLCSFAFSFSLSLMNTNIDRYAVMGNPFLHVKATRKSSVRSTLLTSCRGYSGC